ncbi:HAD-superfamily hydrolase, subfamily IA, variant 1 protein [Halorubrum sp. AJ67]|nr:HAD-superfamily hydrolase, subfamily IA, variant 1 protein [Halorubrum sp. AJ67]
MTYDTVVFDNDGVLVGRTRFDVLRDATRNAFEECGVEEPDPDDVEQMTIGATPGSVGTVCQTYDLDPGSFWRTRDDVVSRAQQQEAREGRKTPYDDLDELQDLDVEMGIVSSNQQATVDFLVDHFDGFERMGAAYGREPTIHSLQLRKPNPTTSSRHSATLTRATRCSSATTSPTSARPRTRESTPRSSAGRTAATGS